MLGRRLRSASSQQVAEVTQYVGCAVASAVAGCGEANPISEHRSNTIELQSCYTQQIYSSIICFALGMTCR